MSKFMTIGVGDHFFINTVAKNKDTGEEKVIAQELCVKSTPLSYTVIADPVMGEIYYDPDIDARVEPKAKAKEDPKTMTESLQQVKESKPTAKKVAAKKATKKVAKKSTTKKP